MQISIELQYLHTGIQINFPLSEYYSSVFSVCTSPASRQIHAIYFLSYFWYFIFCGAAWMQCGACKFFAVRCSERTEPWRRGRSAVKVCPRHL